MSAGPGPGMCREAVSGVGTVCFDGIRVSAKETFLEAVMWSALAENAYSACLVSSLIANGVHCDFHNSI